MQKMNKAFARTAIIGTTTAVLTFYGLFMNGCSGADNARKKGDVVAQMQIEKKEKMPLDSVPKVKIPDVNKLTTFSPFHDWDNKGDTAYSPSYKFRPLLRLTWIDIEDTINPYFLTDVQMKEIKKNPDDYSTLLKNWKTAKIAIRVALVTEKEGITPENALQKHTTEEIKKCLEIWEEIREADKRWRGMRK